jgi:hypothetical protein
MFLREQVEQQILARNPFIDVQTMPRHILYDTFYKLTEKEVGRSQQQPQQNKPRDEIKPTTGLLLSSPLDEMLIRVDQEFGSVDKEIKALLKDLKIMMSLSVTAEIQIAISSMKIKLYNLVKAYYEKIQKTPTIWDSRQGIRYELLLSLFEFVK